MIELCSITGTNSELTQSVGSGLMSLIYYTASSHCGWMAASSGVTGSGGVLPALESRLSAALERLMDRRSFKS